jgi:hypothetical protein
MASRMMPDSATVVVAGDVLASELGSEFVMLNLQDGTYYGLDGVGTDIWKLLQKPITVAEICRVLVSEFDVEPDRCRSDVVKLINDLVTRGLVDVRDP